MNLNFTLTNERLGRSVAWVAEFKATSRFNLHVERKGMGKFAIKQRTTTSGEYADLDNIGADLKKVIDIDFTEGIFPKDIRIVCESQPIMAYVTFAE